MSLTGREDDAMTSLNYLKLNYEFKVSLLLGIHSGCKYRAVHLQLMDWIDAMVDGQMVVEIRGERSDRST